MEYIKIEFLNMLFRNNLHGGIHNITTKCIKGVKRRGVRLGNVHERSVQINWWITVIGLENSSE